MRLFVAADLSDKHLLQKLADIQKQLSHAVQGKPGGHFHFTLQFLGERQHDIPAIKEVLQAVSFESIPLSVTGLGSFPPQRPRVVWAGVDEEAERQLTQLADDIKAALVPLGYNPDKPFKAHITLFRGYDMRELPSIGELGKDTIHSFYLKESELLPDGPRYTNLFERKALK